MQEDFKQLNIFEWMSECLPEIPDTKVDIKGVIDTKTYNDFVIQSTYRDIFIIINMLDDYARVLEQKEDRNFYENYMIEQFKRISVDLTEQIELDKEKMYKKCRSKKNDDVGADAMELLVKKRSIKHDNNK